MRTAGGWMAGTAAGAERVRAARPLVAWVAWVGIGLHALFLTISMAGMQIGLAIALGALVLLALTGQRIWVRSPLDLPVLLLTGLAALSLPVAWAAGSPPPNALALVGWRALIAPLVVLAAIATGPAGEEPGAVRRRALRLAGVWIAAALLPAAVSWIQVRTGLDPLHAIGLRDVPRRAPASWAPGRYAAMGFFTWYPRFAHAMTPVAVLAGALALFAPLARRVRVAAGLAAAAIASAVVLSDSRSAWAGLVAAAVVLAVLAGRRVRAIAIPGVIVAALLVGLLSPGLRVRLSRLNEPEATSDRETIWRVCRAVVADHPITGVGFGTLPRKSDAYYQRLAPEYSLRAWCHDSFFSAWAEGGPLLAFALAGYFALLARAFLRLRRGADGLGRAACAGALATLAATLVNALVHDVFWSSEPTYGLGFLLAVCMAIALPRAEAKPVGEAP